MKKIVLDANTGICASSGSMVVIEGVLIIEVEFDGMYLIPKNAPTEGRLYSLKNGIEIDSEPLLHYLTENIYPRAGSFYY
ncbi:hypothetical protein SAMN02745857_00848 [Andreprevotia lacus DSM 23236]|jgi:hypothetical protein|uniref:Uncharacterized protein n=1 Tax=Andreprevotia lacus DSM 23236 TaxID=1121001 RepID=A0A1W1X8N4_9NEIS|nr:hypothetical protein [Andreprevotia lacus]SMC20177.1 hypothetical protein SAMN02745857_00848 [Andreprevotia lacus DSM 23236]